MNAKDDHWPSLPPIRTTSYNSRVSCETLNLHTSPAAAFGHAHTASDTPSSTSHRPKSASKSADASPFTHSATSPSHVFSSCFPHKFTKGQANDRKRGGAHTHSGALDATGLLRSIFGFSSPMVSYTSGASPSNWQTPPSMTSSPSGRIKPSSTNSPVNAMRSGGTTPHSGLRSSKGHTSHTHAFTMMPPDVVGKKKPLGYESDEPTSPEVTCIGKVRRKHCKATWDALVKEKNKDVKKKKGKAKRLSGEIPPNSDFVVCGNKFEGGESTAAAKFSRQRSEKRRSFDFEGFPTDFDMHMSMHGDSAKEVFIQGMDDGHNSEAAIESTDGDAHTHSLDCAGCDSLSCSKSQGETLDTQRTVSSALSCSKSQGETLDTQRTVSSAQGESVLSEHHEDFEASLCDRTDSATPTLLSETAPPSNCLLLMKKGSRNRSAHYAQLAQEPGHASNQWNWGQVLT